MHSTLANQMLKSFAGRIFLLIILVLNQKLSLMKTTSEISNRIENNEHLACPDELVTEKLLTPDSILDALHIVLEMAENSSLCEPFFEEAEPALAYLSKRLKVSPTAATMLAIIMEYGYSHAVDMSQIARFLKVRILDIVSRNNELEMLYKKRYILKFSNNNGTSYKVPRDVYDAFMKNMCYTFEIPSLKTDDELKRRLNKMFSRIDRCMDDGDVDFDTLDIDLKSLFTKNRHLDLAKVFYSVMKKMSPEELRVLIHLSMLWIYNEDDEIYTGRLGFLFNERYEVDDMETALANGSSALIKLKLLKPATSGGMVEKNVYSLTASFKKRLTPNRTIDDEGEKSKSLTKHTDIVAKPLFYNDDIADEVERLRNLLQPEQMRSVLERMRERGLRGGFTCLLYGGPGTGKTETVLQLAKASGRDVFQVDVSKLRSKWYGESERLVKGLFDDYRNMVKGSKEAPILFFNEADAIFNRRMENATRSVDKGENALQNIILQEMETLNGILIATTNLQGSMDSAFERRFLYKLHLDTPTADVKARIWQSMLPDLTENDAQELAREFDFSGGQIENVVRKRFIDEVMTGEEPNFESLRTLCRNEQLNKKSRNAIGFKV